MNLAWKEIRFHRKKYLLVEILLILLMFMVIFLSGLVNGLGRAVSAGIENIDAAYFAVSDDAEKLITVSELTSEQVNSIEKAASSESTRLDIQRTYLQQDNGEKLDAVYFAIDPNGFLNPLISKGQALSDNKNEIILDESFMEYGITVGSIVKDSSTGIQMEVAGFTKNAMYGHAGIGYISETTYTKLMQERNPAYQERVHTVVIKGKDAADLAIPGIEFVKKAEIIEKIPGYQAEQMTIKMILWVLLIISAAVLGVFFYVITIQKEKQFGIMKAVGMKMSEIAAMIMIQILILAGIGAAAGDFIAFAMSQVLPHSMPFYLNPNDMGEISLAFILIALAGSLLSVGKVSGIDPMITIGGNEA